MARKIQPMKIDDNDIEGFRKAQIVYDMVMDFPIDEFSLDEYEKNINAAIREHIDCASIIAFALIFHHEGGISVSEIARLGGIAKLANDPKQKDKSTVRECWDAWQRRPDSYKGKTAFARDMLDKFPSLVSAAVIGRWCKKWEETTTLPAQ